MAEETNGHEEVEHGGSRKPVFASKFQLNEVDDRVAALETKNGSLMTRFVIGLVLLLAVAIVGAMGLKMGIVANTKANGLQDSLTVATTRAVTWHQAYVLAHESTMVVRKQLADQQQVINQLQADVRRHDADLAAVAATVDGEVYASKAEVAEMSAQARSMTELFVTQQSDSMAVLRQWAMANQEEVEQRYSRTVVGFNDQLMTQRLDIDRLKRRNTILLPLGILNLVWTGVHTAGDSHH